MIDIAAVRENPELVRKMLGDRRSSVDFERLAAVDKDRRSLQVEVDTLRSEKNKDAESYGKLKRAGTADSSEGQDLLAKMKAVDGKLVELESRLKEAVSVFDGLFMQLPNIPHPSVPIGSSEKDNVEVKRSGAPRVFDFKPAAHWDIGETNGVFNLSRASKLAGSRFPLYTDQGARLVRGLINFMLDLHGKKGYTEIWPPVLVNKESMTATGQLPLLESEMFKTQEPDSYYLIPTAEVPLVNIHRNEVIDQSKLPIKYAGYSLSFRREAGSYGKEIRGLIRQHQFDKVELVQFVRPEDSLSALEGLVSDAVCVLEALGLPYRVTALCTADLSFASMKTYDLEVWMPGQDAYVEISSCSSCGDFQARRAGIRFRREPKAKAEFLHTLNGSGVAVGRTVAAILENFQENDGSVRIPEQLQPYFGAPSITRKQ